MNLQYSEKRLETLVENRTVYTLRHSELNIFETYKQAEKVELQFNEPILASMLRGKKIMHLRDKPGFGFYPGESIILPSNELMHIDFPEATEQNPTQCLALRMSKEKIFRLLRWLGTQNWLRLGIRMRIIHALCNPNTVAPYKFETTLGRFRYKGDLAKYLDWNVYFFGSYERHNLDRKSVV